jgi:tRNA A-37 threonylcarbamoyl transferase component Bud32
METWTPQREAQAENFSRATGLVTEVCVLPDDFASRTRNGEFIDTRHDILQRPGLYVTGDTVLSPGPALLDFRYMPELEPGKVASVNQVCFGELNVVDQTGLLTPLTVAVKPRFSATKLAIHEFGAYKHINNQHVIRTYEPLGFLVAEDGKEVLSTYLLTLFEPDIRSFDNFNWEIGTDDVYEGSSVTERARRRLTNLGRAALYLSSMHASGLVHGDAQAKNVAISTRDSATMLVDLETARSLRGKNKMWEATEYDLGANFASDVITFMKSIRTGGFMRDATAEELSNTLNVNFFRLYSSRLRHPISELHTLSRRPLMPENIVAHVKETTMSALADQRA